MPTLRIPLTRGKFALIDAEDFPLASQYVWQAQRAKTKRENWYAIASTSRSSGKRKMVSMHRFLMNAPAGLEVDHINGDGLDNRRSTNLRLCTRSENQMNSLGTEGISGFRGVCRNKKRWKAQIKLGQKRMYLGSFATPHEAARAYDKKALELFGSFARLNFPNDGLRQVRTIQRAGGKNDNGRAD